MKNPKKLFFATAASVLAFATACSERQEAISLIEEGLVTLTASIGDEAKTRVDFDDEQTTKDVKLTWSSEETFSLYRRINDQLSQPETFTKMTEESGMSTATFQGDMPAGGGNTFIAYYPTIPEGTDNPDSRNVTGQTQGSNPTAHLSAYTFMKATTNDPKGGLKFKHLMALLTFELTKPTEFTDEEKINTLKMSAYSDENAGEAETNVFFTTTDNSSDHAKTSELTLTFGNGVNFDANGNLKAYMPVTGGTELPEGIKLTFTLTTDKNTYTYTQKILSDITYKAGKRYTGKITAWMAEKDSQIPEELGDIKDAGSMFGYEKGTIQNPIEISDINGFEALFAINEMTDSEYNNIDWTKQNYKLANDISLSAPTDENTSNWTPIGNYARPFKGTFDGGGHTISNVVIKNQNTATFQRYGFFGYLDGATVKGINVQGEICYGNGSHGGIAGHIVNSTILGCSFKGNIITSLNFFMGGIVGDTVGGGNEIAGCLHEGNITIEGDNKPHVGGIIGRLHGSDMYGCCSKGKMIAATELITDKQHVGNLVGVVHTYEDKNSYIGNCRFVIEENDNGRATFAPVGTKPDGFTEHDTDKVDNLNTKAVVEALNNGIKAYNETATDPYKRCNYHYEVSASGDVPVIRQDAVTE